MDLKNQIDATISPISLATLQVDLERLKPMDGPKKHRIKLLDFRIVFQYSTADIRLHINRFCIDWANGPLKYLPARKLKKEKSLRSILERVLQKATNSRKTLNPNGPVCPVPRPCESVTNDRYQPDERQNSPENAMVSQQLFSQVPTDEHCTANLPSKPGRSLLRAPAELLQRLMPSSRSFLGITSQDPLPRQGAESSAHKGPSQPISGNDQVAHNYQQLGSLAPGRNDSRQGGVFASQIENGSEGNISSESSEPLNLSFQRGSTGPASESEDDDAKSVSSQIPPGSLNEATANEITPIEADSLATQHPATQPLLAMERPSPRKRQRESVGTQSQLAFHENARQESQRDSPWNKRQRIDTSHASLKQLSRFGESAEENLDTLQAEAQSIKTDKINIDPALIRSFRSNQVNPWEGFGGTIPSNEVFIPRDQANLLEEKLWIPPMPNEQMPQGHVPPSLLRQWNNIAVRRHRQAEEANSIPEQPLALTQDTVMSSEHDDSGSEGTPLDWTPTPEKSRFENRLPDSSPVRQANISGMKPVLSLGCDTVDQTNGHDNLGVPTGFDKGFNPQTKHAEASQSAFGASMVEDFRSLEGNDAGADKMASAKISQYELGKGHTDLDQSDRSLCLEGEAPNQAPELSEKLPTRHNCLECAIQLKEDISGDESDESMMDTSVPLGLGESWPDPTQSTQAEQDVVSSGASLSGAKRNNVQVAETPANNNSRLHGNESSKPETEFRPHHTQTPSSQAHKTSSPSRVLSTYPHHGSYEKSQTSNDGLGSSSHPASNGSPRVDVEGTQTQNSSTNVPFQGATQSQEIVLDSSDLANRQQDFSLSGQQAVPEPLTLIFASSNEPTSTQLNQQSQRSVEGYLSQDVPIISSQESTTGHSRVPVAEQDYSPAKTQRSLPPDNELVDESLTDVQTTQSAALVARRLAHIGNPDKVAQAREVYKRFCDDYPSYTGDFDHFIELCSRLQAVRVEGKLQQSLLWDDFIIMHLQQYSSHIEQRASQDSMTLSYEEYFLLNFTHPTHRKRSLAAHGVELAASQFIPTKMIPPVANSQVQPDSPAAQVEVQISSLAIPPAENPPQFACRNNQGSRAE
ncbi:uncharacterized protein N7477_000804 [Penicillium maclennaniae]|uniref:uncharacterized protein n=1 Tax=Penicillium maclennaniae TaxID=1343394 RepID=UPI00254078FB|nr:uncharacterized protein N7477_000804 [Penicillium maclennaniae]KAJ5684459.1 hypothetical protein N7477_000804 [Penicillium maclennaniae]